MFKKIGLVLTCLVLTACTTTNTKVATGLPDKPPAGARILLMRPDVSLSELNAAGIDVPKAEWNETSRANLTEAIQASLKAKAHSFSAMDPSASMTGRTGQILRLNEAVTNSIALFGMGAIALPTKKTFDWTLGPGTRELKASQNADYALFIHSHGNWSSGGRQAARVLLAIGGVSLPPAMQLAQASLVDLETGRIVWSNYTVAGPTADQRTAAGAKILVESLLKDIPL
jgi:hypothetical protein